jgi:molybdopterin-guanine dinucleotide biosynthesis protein A
VSKVTSIIIANELTYIPLPNRFYSTASDSSVLEYMLDALWTVFDNTLVISSVDPPYDLLERINPFGARIIMNKGKSLPEMLGVSLDYVETPISIIVSGDRPLLKPSVLFTISYNIGNFECAVPRWKDKNVDPFLASYKTEALKKVLKRVKPHDYSSSFIDMFNDVLYLSVENELIVSDPELYSFMRLKSVEDKEKIINILNYKGSS